MCGPQAAVSCSTSRAKRGGVGMELWQTMSRGPAAFALVPKSASVPSTWPPHLLSDHYSCLGQNTSAEAMRLKDLRADWRHDAVHYNETIT
eukprot:1314880-Amphidinium_carterae.1